MSSLIPTLNDTSLKQGDRYDMTLVFNNRSKLADGHPLKTDGFGTAGYTIRFVAKPDIKLADNAVGVIFATGTAIDGDNATVTILPSATAGISFGDRSTLDYVWDAQVSDGGDNVYTVATGEFTLMRDIAVNV